MRLLVPTDGSENALAATRFALKLAQEMPGSQIHLLNVQRPIKGTATAFLGSDTVRQYHEEEGQAALASGEALLREAGVPFEARIARGLAAETINAYAEEQGCDMIVMGARGTGMVAALLGSTADAVLADAKVPVTLIR
jgi:nucleotide-binding universal stress UspA family protein